MQSPGREPSMEDILASIKKVIAEEKELRASPRSGDVLEDEPLPEEMTADEDVLELNEPLAPPVGNHSIQRGDMSKCSVSATVVSGPSEKDDTASPSTAALSRPVRSRSMRNALPMNQCAGCLACLT